jgi:hypothetical protein
MRCAHCGKQVPFLGRECPYCGADKSEMQALWMLGVVCAGAGLAVGLHFGGLRGLLLGGFLGGGICVVTQLLVNRRWSRDGPWNRDSQSKPALKGGKGNPADMSPKRRISRTGDGWRSSGPIDPAE